jgi:hypothetical protein
VTNDAFGDPDLLAFVRGAALVELPAIRAALARAETELLLRLRLDGPRHDPGGTSNPEPVERWLTPEQVATANVKQFKRKAAVR